MRKQPAKRYHTQPEHNSYGIYNWFKWKGITDKEVMEEVIYSFCLKFGFEGLNPKTPERTLVNFVSNRFEKFAPFAGNYLKENNYA